MVIDLIICTETEYMKIMRGNLKEFNIVSNGYFFSPTAIFLVIEPQFIKLGEDKRFTFGRIFFFFLTLIV